MYAVACLISSVRSSSVNHGLVQIRSSHFSKNFKFGAILLICIHNSLSVFNEQNRIRQYFCINCIENAYKVLQISVRPNIFSKCMEFKDIKYDIPLCHEGHEDICIFLHFSAFHYISLHFSTFICISHAILCISLNYSRISLHISAFLCVSLQVEPLPWISERQKKKIIARSIIQSLFINRTYISKYNKEHSRL